MGFEITISDDGGYLIGKVNGLVTIEIAQQMTEEYVKRIESTGIKRILNDVRGARSKMSAIEDYRLAYSDVPSTGLPRGIKAAILADENDFSHNFQETVATNAGYFIKLFHSYGEAVRWLNQDHS